MQPRDASHGQGVGWMYSGLTNEKPRNSSWSRLDMSSWSGGVSSGGWRVKKRSKFSASRPHCRGEERHGRMEWVWWRGERKGVGGLGEHKKRTTTTNKRKKRNTTKTWHQPIKSLTAKITVEFHWSKWKQWHLCFIIGDYTDNRSQVCSCQSSDQWEGMVMFQWWAIKSIL